MKKPPKNLELKKHEGCKDCIKTCLYNSYCATPNIAERSKGYKFPCNNTKRK